ncbi:AI-2E family transporter [Aerococcus urinaeequi]|uniref:AI-2E family transporter n=1 Tax=Aerococcus urinaeequi TaxID=51665 RepID=A0AAC9A662_9LACT|nr:AI-2E family transporter [Aerococcus urinaeequi]AMB96737.1 hypothetical protein AWM74_00170 [Aerococcus urinaeequi]
MNDKINPEETPASKDQTAFSKSWFFKYILNNRYTGALIIGILIVIFVSLFTRVSYLLDPAVSFIQYVSLPIVVAAIFYYLTVPLVNQIEKGGLNRTWGSAIVLLLIAVVVTGLVALIPTVADEGRNLINNWDTIWTDYQSRLQTLIRGDWYDQVNMVVQSSMNNVLDLSSFNWESIANSAITSVSSIVGTVTRVTVAIFTAPIILFYMLRDGHKLPTYFAQFLPIKIRKATLHLLSDMNLQISQYIRGQIIVAIGVAIMFVVGYSIVGLPYGVIIGVAAGFLNVIPYVGSFIAMVPAIIVAIVVGPMMIVKVLIVFAIEQTIESRVISPQVLGSNMAIHPVTIMLLLISAGSIFGVAGVVFVIPIFAVIKVMFSHLFAWYKRVSGLYLEEEGILEDAISEDTPGK